MSNTVNRARGLGHRAGRTLWRPARDRARDADAGAPLRMLIVAVTVLLSGACHVYREIPSGPLPAAGASLAVQLTDSGAVVLARDVGPSADVLEGSLVHADTGSVTLSVRRVLMRDGLSNDWAGERVTVARALIASVSEKRLSRVRSLIFAGGIIAGAALGATGVSGIVGGGRGGRGGPGGER